MEGQATHFQLLMLEKMGVPSGFLSRVRIEARKNGYLPMAQFFDQIAELGGPEAVMHVLDSTTDLPNDREVEEPRRWCTRVGICY